MFKRILSFCLVLAVLGSSCTRFLVYAWFEVNHAKIVNTLCENRNRPLVICDGQCYLNKKVKQLEKHSKKQAGMEEKSASDQLLPPSCLEDNLLFTAIRSGYSSLLIARLSSRPSPVFQPPRA